MKLLNERSYTNKYALPVPFRDSLFLGLVVGLSVSLYIQRLGFYSDDWAFLAAFQLSGAQSLEGLFKVFYVPLVWMRPVQGLYLSILYGLFGLQPLGYHIVNAVVILAGAVLFYLALMELGQPRIVALAVPTLYVLMPHYSTDRFWYAAFQATLSMTLYFLSLYADLRAMRATARLLWVWKLLAITSLLVSTLSYEVFLPLFLLNPLLVWYRQRQRADSRYAWTQIIPFVMIGLNWSTVAAVTLFKLAITTRMHSIGLSEQLRWFFAFFSTIAKEAIRGDFGLRLPVVLSIIVRDYPNPLILITGAAVGVIVFGYLVRAVVDSEPNGLDRSTLFKIMACGPIVFGLGYSIFLTNPSAGSSPTGISNRIAIAATIGVALALVGGLGWISTWLPSIRWRKGFFCALVAMISTSGFVVINTLALFWITAAQRQQLILESVRQRIPVLPSHSTLILDGVCPYVGPAPVFETQWDWAGALQLLYQDSTLLGDVVTPRLEIGEEGLSTEIYDDPLGPYPYTNLLVYNYRHNLVYPLDNAEAARLYFQTFNPDRNSGCRWSAEGTGELLFMQGDPKISLLP